MPGGVNFDVRKTIDNVAGLIRRVEELTTSDVLIGVPADKAGRKEGQINNATLAYIHEFGSPARNIPARPFLYPGIRKIRAQAMEMLRQAAMDALKGSTADVSVVLNKVGMLARNSVVNEITDPAPPFVPLKPSTIRGRLRRTAAGRRKLQKFDKIKAAAGWTGAQSGAALSMWAEAGNIQPLIDTGALRASLTYVVRKA